MRVSEWFLCIIALALLASTIDIQAADSAAPREIARASTTAAGCRGRKCDTIAPTVSLTSPAAGATVSGTITVNATASDNVGVVGVQFQLDGVALGAEDTSAPYAVSWNTTTAANGSHILTAIARDAAGNKATSALNVTVANVDTTPPTISNVNASNISSNAATIGWTTNEAADSQVEYGLTTAYGSSTALDSTLVTAHSQTLTGLTASTTYHYRVKSRDAAGNLATSADATFTTLATGGPISGLHVVGNTLQNDAGQQIIIHGVNRSGPEYACIEGWGFFDPPGSDSPSAVQAIAAWQGVNAVRIPMNEDCWLAINGAPAAYSGANYQTAIKNYVDRLAAANLIAILDLHWTAPGTQQAMGQQPMLNRDHSLAFWSQVANAFKNNSSVIFDVHNEPFPDNNNDTNEAWRCWRDGGTCSGMSFQAAGMQEVVNTIRATGATNVIMLGGVQYSNALTQWLSHKPSDPLNNLAAAWHMYGGNICSSQACWDQAPATTAAQVPVIAGEFGEHYDGAHCTTTLVGTFMNWMDAKQLGYVAWTFNSWGDCLSLVTDVMTGAPTAWGTFYKNHVATQ